MKWLWFLFCIVLFSSSGFSQIGDGGGEHSQCELNFQIINNINQYTVDFVTTPVWNSANFNSSHTYFTNSACNFIPVWQGFFENASKTISLQGVANLCRDNGFHYGMTPPGQTGCSNWPNYSASYFQSGLYYVVIKVNGVEKTHFYYDNRNGQFPTNPCFLPGLTSNDIGVRYNVDKDSLYYMKQPHPYHYYDGWEPFEKGEVLNWWEITNTISGLNFSGYNTRYFAILNEPQNINYSPYLTWQAPNVSQTIDHYQLQRSWGSLPFQTIYTTNSELSYHDYSIHWNPGAPNNQQLVQYRVVVVYADQDWPHEYSNTQKLFVNRNLQKKNNVSDEISTFRLNQNYPNPFNSETRISYYIPSENFVTLIVYNSLGHEIKKLVSEHQRKGLYEINFRADLLSSGVYFYKLSVGNYKSTHKMIYLK